jgi:predicted metal-dependent hydrolase
VVEPGSVIFGATTIAYSIRRSRRRKKTIEITLDPSEGVVVSAPVKATAAEVARIVQRRAGWIIRKSTESILRPRPKQFVSGESLPYLGREARLFVLRSDAADQDERRGRARVRVAFDHWSFRVVAPDQLAADDRRAAILHAITRWYKQRAQERLEARVLLWSGKLGCQVTRIVTRDQRQRWGSCAPDGTIRFNWRIVMAEPALIDYVVVHELLHLRVRNHSADFWSEMVKAMPDYRVRRERLKEFGRRVAF